MFQLMSIMFKYLETPVILSLTVIQLEGGWDMEGERRGREGMMRGGGEGREEREEGDGGRKLKRKNRF